MFKDKQSPGVCGVEAEVLLYAQSPSEALDTYMCISSCCGCPYYSHCFDLLICCWGTRGKLVSEGIKDFEVMHGVHFASHLTLGHWMWLDFLWAFPNLTLRSKNKEAHEKNKIRERTGIWKKAWSDCCTDPVSSVWCFSLWYCFISLYVILQPF